MPKKKKAPIWILILILFLIFGGIFAIVIGLNNIKNYTNPYLFVIIFGGCGFVSGFWISKKLKQKIAITQNMKNEYYKAIFSFSVGFFGLFILSGSYLNESLSDIEKCGVFEVINKYKREKVFRFPEKISLEVKIDNNNHRMICSKKFWNNTLVGDRIYLCLYKSNIGFDFATLPDDIKNK